MAAYSGKPDAVDYSFSRANIQQLEAAGIKLVSRYLSHTDAKNLSATEAGALLAAGIGILLNWESANGRPLLGGAAGAADGRDAAAMAESLGAPHGLTIYYSCDRDVTSSQFDAIAAYYQQAGNSTAGRYRVGIYGELSVIDEMHRRGVVTSEWQTYAWSNGKLSANTDLYQYLNSQTLAGAGVDFDKIMHPAELGAWWPAGHAPSGGSGNPIGDDVTPEQMQQLLDAIHKAASDAAALVHNDASGTYDRVKDMAGDTAGVNGVVEDAAIRTSQYLSGTISRVTDIAAKVNALNADSFAAAVVAKLPSGAAGVTEDQLKQAVKDALKEGVN